MFSILFIYYRSIMELGYIYTEEGYTETPACAAASVYWCFTDRGNCQFQMICPHFSPLFSNWVALITGGVKNLSRIF